MSELKAIQTVYRGYKMRSRLEARWAVFFDALGIKWEYEKEGYNLPEEGPYLPDFWLPSLECWIEIKGQEPTKEEGRKCAELARETRHMVYLFFGEIPMPVPEWEESGQYGAFRFSPDLQRPYNILAEYVWCACPICGHCELTRHGWMHLLKCHGTEFSAIHAIESAFSDDDARAWWMKRRDTAMFGGDYPSLVDAYTQARHARFEHGERP